MISNRSMSVSEQKNTQQQSIRVLCLVPPFHGHARPMWQLACELSLQENLDCVFIDFFSNTLNYPGEVQVYRIPTGFNDFLLNGSQEGDNPDLVALLSQAMADFYLAIQAPLSQFAESYKPDIILSDYFFSLGPSLAKVLDVPYLVAYSSPDIFFIDQNKENRLALMEVMMEQKKFAGFSEVMKQKTDMELYSFNLSPYGNISFSPDIMKLKNPSGFLVENRLQGEVCWHQFHSFFDDKIYPLVAVNHAAVYRNPDDNDRELAAYLSDSETTSILISFGTVWLRQLGDKKTAEAFVNLLRGLLMASNDSKYRILYSGDDCYIQQAMSGLELSSQVVVKQYINQSYLVQFADVFVFHGGHNSFCESMVARTPMLIFPKGFDQGRIADLACRLGVGERISFTKNTPNLIAMKLQKLTQDLSYHQRLQEEAEHFSKPLNTAYVYQCLQSVIAHYPRTPLE